METADLRARFKAFIASIDPATFWTFLLICAAIVGVVLIPDRKDKKEPEREDKSVPHVHNVTHIHVGKEEEKERKRKKGEESTAASGTETKDEPELEPKPKDPETQPAS